SINRKMTRGCIGGQKICDGAVIVSIAQAYTRAQRGNSDQFHDSAAMGGVGEWPVFRAHLPVAKFALSAMLKLSKSLRGSGHKLFIFRAKRFFQYLLQLDPCLG